MVNQLRYELFFAKGGEIEDTLKKHAMRANYQAGIWRRSLENDPDTLDPVGYGWKSSEDGQLVIDWMDGMPAPDAVLEMIACHCKNACIEGECVCLDKSFWCTQMCELQDCSNMQEYVFGMDKMDEEIESDDDSEGLDDAWFGMGTDFIEH